MTAASDFPSEQCSSREDVLTDVALLTDRMARMFTARHQMVVAGAKLQESFSSYGFFPGAQFTHNIDTLFSIAASQRSVSHFEYHHVHIYERPGITCT